MKTFYLIKNTCVHVHMCTLCKTLCLSSSSHPSLLWKMAAASKLASLSVVLSHLHAAVYSADVTTPPPLTGDHPGLSTAHEIEPAAEMRSARLPLQSQCSSVHALTAQGASQFPANGRRFLSSTTLLTLETLSGTHPITHPTLAHNTSYLLLIPPQSPSTSAPSI